jgi:hypothetical protein
MTERTQTVEPVGIISIIDYMEATPEASWEVGVVRSKDGTRNCFFGHLFEMAGDDATGNLWWGYFEDAWATTYMIYPVNDGSNSVYQQPTPKQRILAYLRDLRDGKAETTWQLMEADYQASMHEGTES